MTEAMYYLLLPILNIYTCAPLSVVPRYFGLIFLSQTRACRSVWNWNRGDGCHATRGHHEVDHPSGKVYLRSRLSCFFFTFSLR